MRWEGEKRRKGTLLGRWECWFPTKPPLIPFDRVGHMRLITAACGLYWHWGGGCFITSRWWWKSWVSIRPLVIPHQQGERTLDYQEMRVEIQAPMCFPPEPCKCGTYLPFSWGESPGSLPALLWHHPGEGVGYLIYIQLEWKALLSLFWQGWE